MYTVAGLPVHAFVVHFAVVVLPISATALIAMIYVPKIRSKYSFISVVGIVLGSVAVLVAKQSGEALSEKIGLPVEHSDYGTYLTIAAFVFMCLSLLWYRSAKGRKSGVVTPLGHVTALAAIAVLTLTFLTGHTGAQAVWEGKLNPDKSTQSANSTAVFSAADLKKNATASSCWSVINGDVYDLTKWIGKHPGGQSVIKALCGVDGSAMFDGQHGGDRTAIATLANYKIGKFA